MIRKIGKEGVVLTLTFLLTSCCNNTNNINKESDGKNTLLHRLELIKKPICKLETYKNVIECLLMYNEALKQSNIDKERMINNY